MAEDISGEFNFPSTLMTTMSLLNESPPIIGAQFEIWYSEWPRLRWLAQGITVPGLTSKTLPISYSGFQVPVIINTTYDGDMTLQMDILADEYGQYYAHWRNATIFYSMDKQKGKPILGAGEPVKELYGVMQGQRYLVVKLVNDPNSNLQHCWRFHNFKVTGVGEVKMGQTDTDLLTFSVSGIYTHISYTQDRANSIILGGVASEVETSAPENATGPQGEEQLPVTAPTTPTTPTTDSPGGGTGTLPDTGGGTTPGGGTEIPSTGGGGTTPPVGGGGSVPGL